MRMILASRDPVALDTIEALVMNWDPESVKYLRYLSDDGMGNLNTANIIVAGKQVDEVRKDFAGVTPSAGGERVYDKTPPSLSIISNSLDGGILHLSLQTDKKTTKIQVYCDGKLIEPVITKDFNDSAVDLGKLSSGSHEILVDSFDRFLNRSEKKIEVSSGK